MRTIYSPSGNGSERWQECVEALEPAFMQLVDRAQQAGWCTNEVVEALALLARLAAESTAKEAQLKRDPLATPHVLQPALA